MFVYWVIFLVCYDDEAWNYIDVNFTENLHTCAEEQGMWV
jgi:hypothetical protein